MKSKAKSWPEIFSEIVKLCGSIKMHDHNLWSGDVTVLRHSGKAMLCEYENEEAWIPYSQIHSDSEVWEETEVGEYGKLVIPLWLAEKKSWA
jgi:hypothetical protein